jgi:hypothetical protein
MIKRKHTMTVRQAQPYDELFLQPWFLPEPIFREVRQLLPASLFLKMRYYFEDHGCLRCASRNSVYGSNGMCKKCNIVVRGRIILCLKRRFRKIGTKVPKAPIKRYLAGLQSLSLQRDKGVPLASCRHARSRSSARPIICDIRD